MLLLIDLGNSRFKWRCDDAHGSFMHKDADLAALLKDTFAALPAPEKIALSNVAGDQLEKTVIDWCGLHWPKAKLVLAKLQNPVPALASNYSSHSLGVDRWLAMLAVASKNNNRPFIVIDCGSAVTIDAVNGASVHLGGVIIPGLNMLHSSLVTGAVAIQQAMTLVTNVMAMTTADAVSAGCINTLAAGIDAVVNKMQAELGKSAVNCYLTGGDADRIRPMLVTDVFLESELVLEGLRKYVELDEC
ncbi:MAG: type III pantothenate kinase [Gammaproteobacteria bacterium]|nr:type III pantothenate kinase [Gammaproteobacteria bacterium]